MWSSCRWVYLLDPLPPPPTLYLTVCSSCRWVCLLAHAPLTHYLTVWSSCRWVYLLDPAPPSLLYLTV